MNIGKPLESGDLAASDDVDLVLASSIDCARISSKLGTFSFSSNAHNRLFFVAKSRIRRTGTIRLNVSPAPRTNIPIYLLSDARNTPPPDEPGKAVTVV